MDTQGTEESETYFFDGQDLSQVEVVIDGREGNNYSSVQSPQQLVINKNIKCNQNESSSIEQGMEKNKTYFDLSQTEDNIIEASQSLLQPMKKPQKLVVKQKIAGRQEEPSNKRTKNDNIDKITMAVDTLKEISQNPKGAQIDEYDAFGKVVAAHLRNLPEDAALESQGDILNYLIERRLGRKASLMNIDVSSPSPSPHDASSSASWQTPVPPKQY